MAVIRDFASRCWSLGEPVIDEIDFALPSSPTHPQMLARRAAGRRDAKRKLRRARLWGLRLAVG